MTYKKERLDNFNGIEFIKDIERRYGRKVACNVANSLLRLSAVSMNSNYLSELSSPRFVIRLKLHPITGGLIVETINDKRKGYRYTFTPSKVNRKKVNYDKAICA